MLSTINWLFLLALAIWKLAHAHRLRRRSKGLPYPNGPVAGALVAYSFLRPHPKISLPWKKLFDMWNTYGDIIGFDLFGRQMIIINSYDVAKDMLEKNAAIYSDRPTMAMFGGLMGFSDTFALAPYGALWREQRGVLHQVIAKGAMAGFHTELWESALRILADALNNPHGVSKSLRLRIGGMILKTAYGITITSLEDPYLKDAEKLIQAITSGMFGRYLVDFFPSLAHIPSFFPFTGFKKEAKYWRTAHMEIMNRPFEYATSQEGKRSEPSCLVNRLISSGKNPDTVKMAVGTLYAAGTDSTATVISAFLLSMMLFPAVQRTAQEELDSVLGTSSRDEVLRLPTFDDQSRLPYLEALIKEVYRWHPATPMGPGHAPIQDDVFEGYFIPDDTFIVANQWGMSRDENYYPDPEEFRPERYLGENPALNPRDISFGFGRRKCVGLHFADAAIFITISFILSTLNISKRVGDGSVEPDLRIGHASVIDNLACNLTPRSPGAAALINETLQSLDNTPCRQGAQAK
ncbi:cytochrome P450 [Cantharellus anzutake]|uniref:cytochrome P450 n=1 Tax=Cantharellus anzutake TaxID=1750568 RepID=UPI00190774E1|nr:cytochrome P450 [Cantharellus anzutake]KAF8331354.1 cytochrome P450 [Cantharellus anzutake]